MVRKKILVLSTGDINGAYEAMFKVSEILIDLGHEVVLCVKEKTKSHSFIKQYQQNQNKYEIVKSLYCKIKRKFGLGRLSGMIVDPKYVYISVQEEKSLVNAEEMIKQVGFIPDFIFTGMTTWFVNSTDLKNLYFLTKAQIYNITVDMNHFTGGCHFSWGCNKYITGCDSKCPAIVDLRHQNLAPENFNIKLKNAKIANFKIIAGSGLTLMQAKNSKIYSSQKKIYNINSLIDTTLLNPNLRLIAKQVFGFKEDKFYILCGAQHMADPRKGFKYFIEALKKLEVELSDDIKEKIVIVVVSHNISEEFESLKFKKQKIEYIKDYRLLSLLYQAVDLYVNTSVEDSGPMMVSEALACGTPVVGFNTGILLNMVENGKNGYKVDVADTNGLAGAIYKMIFLEKDKYKMFSEYSVNMVEQYSSYNYAKDILTKILYS